MEVGSSYGLDSSVVVNVWVQSQRNHEVTTFQLKDPSQQFLSCQFRESMTWLIEGHGIMRILFVDNCSQETYLANVML